MKRRAIIVFLAISTIIALCGCTPPESQYTYTAWAKQAHYPTPCDLENVKSNDREATAYLCKRTHTVPTKDQRIAWQSYLIYVSCYEYHQQSDCSELND